MYICTYIANTPIEYVHYILHSYSCRNLTFTWIYSYIRTRRYDSLKYENTNQFIVTATHYQLHCL